MVVDVVGDEELGISSIALAELLHGIYREARGEMREGRC
jgi:predicted nucleic acid-binding protein